jgi:hypothetical protein
MAERLARIGILVSMISLDVRGRLAVGRLDGISAETYEPAIPLANPTNVL